MILKIIPSLKIRVESNTYVICFNKKKSYIILKKELLAMFNYNIILYLVLKAVYKWIEIFILYTIKLDFLIQHYFGKIMAKYFTCYIFYNRPIITICGQKSEITGTKFVEYKTINQVY